MNPKVILGIGDLLGCGYYRCVLPYKALAKRGFNVTLTNVLHPNITKDYDAVVLQRQHHPGVVENARTYKKIRPNGKIVFEFDDNLHAVPASNPSSVTYRNGLDSLRNMEVLLKMADLLTVSTPVLRREYLRFNDNIHVCFNAADPEVVAQVDALKVPPRSDSHFRLGWAGSGTHLDDLRKIFKPLAAVMMEYQNLRFVWMGSDMRRHFPVAIRSRMEYFGDTFPKDKNGNAVCYSQNELNPTVEYLKMLRNADLDAAIAPLESYLFNSCKSYIKAIEYGIANIPFVASRFGPYSEYVQGTTKQVALLADSDNEWKRSIKDLMLKPDLRETLKLNNKEYVLSNHLVDHKVQQWIDAFASIGISPGNEPGHYEEKIEKSQQVAYY